MGDYKVLVYGDSHLSSKDYGSHKDYKNETLELFRDITRTAEATGCNVIIGLGDFAMSMFNDLDYRRNIEVELEKQYRMCNGNRYELKGNHDISTKGKTEYEFYVEKGLIRQANYLDLGENVSISMVNFGEIPTHEVGEIDRSKTNIMLVHDYVRFKDTRLPMYGGKNKVVWLDNQTNWAGMDYVIAGHIHNFHTFKGTITKNDMAYETMVTYLGCPSRPAYRKSGLQEKGYYAIIDCSQKKPSPSILEWELPSIEDTFMFEDGVIVELAQERRESKIEVAAIINKLDAYDKVMGNPEEIINNMGDLDPRYKAKALELLRNAN